MFTLFYMFFFAGWLVVAECAYRVGCYRTERQNPVHAFGRQVRLGYWLTVGVFSCLYLSLLLQMAPVVLRTMEIDTQIAREFAVAAQYSPWLLLCVVPAVAYRLSFQRALVARRVESGASAQHRQGTWNTGAFFPARHYRLSRGHYHMYPRSTWRTAGGFKSTSGSAKPFGGGQTSGRGAARSFAGSTGSIRSVSIGRSGGSATRSTGHSGATFGGGKTSGRGAGRSFASANQQAAVSGAVVASARPAKASGGKRSGKKGKGNGGKGAAPLLVLLIKVIVWVILAALAFLLGWLTTHLLEGFATAKRNVV